MGTQCQKMTYTPVTPVVSIGRFLNLDSDALLRFCVADRWFTTGAQLCRASPLANKELETVNQYIL